VRRIGLDIAWMAALQHDPPGKLVGRKSDVGGLSH
jgi:hypothetical protein